MYTLIDLSINISLKVLMHSRICGINRSKVHNTVINLRKLGLPFFFCFVQQRHSLFQFASLLFHTAKTVFVSLAIMLSRPFHTDPPETAAIELPLKEGVIIFR